MRTQHVHNQLPDFVNGKLDDTLQREVIAHLDECAECRAEAEHMGEVFRSLQPFPKTLPPTGYFSALLPRIREHLDRDYRFAWLKSPFMVRFAAPLVTVIIIASLVTRINVSDPSLAESLTLDDVADVLVRQTETQLFAEDNVEQFAASALPEETFERQIIGQLVTNGDNYSFDNLAGSSIDLLLENLSEEEIETLLQRLEEGSSSL